MRTIPPRLLHKLNRIFEPDPPYDEIEAMNEQIDLLGEKKERLRTNSAGSSGMTRTHFRR